MIGGSLVRSYRTSERVTSERVTLERVTLEQQMSAPDVERSIAALRGELPHM